MRPLFQQNLEWAPKPEGVEQITFELFVEVYRETENSLTVELNQSLLAFCVERKIGGFWFHSSVVRCTGKQNVFT